MREYASTISIVIMLTFVGCDRPPEIVMPKAYPRPADGFPSIREQERWKAEEFFSDQSFLAICDAISMRDDSKLESLLTDGLDLNVQGTGGFTLLHWAYAEYNMSAYKMLLEHGASPDLLLTDHILGRRDCVFVRGHSILFTTTHRFRVDYCLEALPYSKNVNQRLGPNNLLHIYFLAGLVASESNLQKLIAAGIDVNAVGSYGCTPCLLAASSSRPRLCIILIEAGADPTIADDEGNDVLSRLQRNRENLAKLREDTAAYDEVLKYLKEHARNDAQLSP